MQDSPAKLALQNRLCGEEPSGRISVAKTVLLSVFLLLLLLCLRGYVRDVVFTEDYGRCLPVSPHRDVPAYFCVSLCPCRTKSNLNLVPTPAFASSSSLPSLRHGPMTGAFAALLDRGLYSSGAAYGVRFSSFTASLIGVSDCYCFFSRWSD